MKILFDDQVQDATITAGSASGNYPASNLADAFLYKRYQHTAATYDTVTFQWSEDKSISSVFFGYTNAGQIDIRLYDSGDSLLASESLTGTFGDAEAVHWDTAYSARYMEIDVYGHSGGYLGGAAAGVCEELPDPMSGWEEPLVDNSIVVNSLYGQVTQNYVEPLRAYSWMFRDLTRTRTDELRAAYNGIGVGGHVWVDPFESDHDFMAPLYATISAAPTTVKNGRRYDMNFELQEAR